MTAPALTPPPAPDPTARRRFRLLPAGEQQRERLAVTWVFLLSGLTMGGWLARIPDIKGGLGLSDARWGTIVLCTAAGVLTAMLLARRLLGSVGARPLQLVAVPGALFIPAAFALASQPWQLAVGLVGWGLANGTLHASMNAQAVIVERDYGRVLMTGFHATWSAGALLGGLIGAVAADQIAPSAQFAVTGSVLVTVAAALARWLPHDGGIKAPRQKRTLTPQLALIAFVAFCSQICEGAATQWSTIYMREFLATSASLAPMAFAGYSFAMATGRIVGGRVVERFGRVRTISLATIIGSVGFAAGLLSGTATGTIAGFVVLGFGLSCIIPSAFSLAGAQPGISPGAGVTTIGIATWPAMLLGPPLIGYLSEATSLQTALLTIAAVIAAVSLLSRRIVDVRPQPA